MATIGPQSLFKDLYFIPKSFWAIRKNAFPIVQNGSGAEEKRF